MPPYFADPHIGKFQNDQALTADQNPDADPLARSRRAARRGPRTS
jgi:hypothetical protein